MYIRKRLFPITLKIVIQILTKYNMDTITIIFSTAVSHLLFIIELLNKL